MTQAAQLPRQFSLVALLPAIVQTLQFWPEYKRPILKTLQGGAVVRWLSGENARECDG